MHFVNDFKNIEFWKLYWFYVTDLLVLSTKFRECTTPAKSLTSSTCIKFQNKQNIVAAFRGMHVSPANQEKCDYCTDRHTHTQTDAGQSDPYLPLCFTGDTKSFIYLCQWYPSCLWPLPLKCDLRNQYGLPWVTCLPSLRRKHRTL